MLRDLVSKEKIDFLAIQETKMEVVSDALCYFLWGSEDCDWLYLPSEGNSGGILSIWRKSSSSLIFNFKGEGFVGVCLEWGVHKTVCFVVNVYSKCDINGKRRLWETLLMSKRGFGGGAWCVIGDFNAVLHTEERRGVNNSTLQSPSTEIVEFEAFVNNMELVDIPVLGRKFSWVHSNGSSMSRIDRAFISEDWSLRWGNPSLWILPRSVSDHCPLVLRYNNVDWGPRPFRFNNHWLNHGNFRGKVEEFWSSNLCEGWMGFILKEKLKGLKETLKVWNKEVYGEIDTKISFLVEEIKEKDLRGEVGSLSAEEVVLRRKHFFDLWHLLKSKELSAVQRSRSRWLKEGDANSRYFHSVMNSRGKRNRIMALEVGGEWSEDPLIIRQEAVSFFKNQFQNPQWQRPQLDGVPFSLVSQGENDSLIQPFSLEEIEGVVVDCDGN
jgi:exonuclease III